MNLMSGLCILFLLGFHRARADPEQGLCPNGGPASNLEKFIKICPVKRASCGSWQLSFVWHKFRVKIAWQHVHADTKPFEQQSSVDQRRSKPDDFSSFVKGLVPKLSFCECVLSGAALQCSQQRLVPPRDLVPDGRSFGDISCWSLSFARDTVFGGNTSISWQTKVVPHTFKTQQPKLKLCRTCCTKKKTTNKTNIERDQRSWILLESTGRLEKSSRWKVLQNLHFVKTQRTPDAKGKSTNSKPCFKPEPICSGRHALAEDSWRWQWDPSVQSTFRLIWCLQIIFSNFQSSRSKGSISKIWTTSRYVLQLIPIQTLAQAWPSLSIGGNVLLLKVTIWKRRSLLQ